MLDPDSDDQPPSPEQKAAFLKDVMDHYHSLIDPDQDPPPELNNPAFMKDVEDGNLERVEHVLEATPSLSNAIGDGKRTALHVASEKGHTSIVEILLRHGAEVKARDRYGLTALHVASTHVHPSIVEMLLRAGAEVDVQDKRGWSALHSASLKGCTETVEALLRSGADTNMKDGVGIAPLAIASANGNTSIVEMLLSHGADVNATDSEQLMGALYLASENGHTSVVKMLLSHGADVNITALRSRTTALQRASNNGHSSIVEMLLSNGADANVKDLYGKPALYMAYENGHTSIVEMLLAGGVDIDDFLEHCVSRRDVEMITTIAKCTPHLAVYCEAAMNLKDVPPRQFSSVVVSRRTFPKQTAISEHVLLSTLGALHESNSDGVLVLDSGDESSTTDEELVPLRFGWSVGVIDAIVSKLEMVSSFTLRDDAMKHHFVRRLVEGMIEKDMKIQTLSLCVDFPILLEYLPQILASCPHLTSLSLSGVHIDWNAAKFVSQLLTNSGIQSLNLSHCDLEDVTMSVICSKLCQNRRITSLDVSNNNLRSLPTDLRLFANLKRFVGNENKYNDPKLGAIVKGTATDHCDVPKLFDYLQSLEEDGEVLRRGRLMVLGRGEAGKTTMVNALINESTNTSESISKSDRTVNIDFNFVWSPQCENIKVSMCDFGGQKTYLSTHQMFLTDDSVYLLIWNGSQSEGDNAIGLSKSAKQVLKWISCLHDQCRNCRVVLVATHCGGLDAGKWKARNAALREAVNNMLHDLDLRSNTGPMQRRGQLEVVNSGNSFQTDGLSGLGIPVLREAVLSELMKTQNYGTKVSSSYIQMEETKNDILSSNWCVREDKFLSIQRNKLAVKAASSGSDAKECDVEVEVKHALEFWVRMGEIMVISQGAFSDLDGKGEGEGEDSQRWLILNPGKFVHVISQLVHHDVDGAVAASLSHGGGEDGVMDQSLKDDIRLFTSDGVLTKRLLSVLWSPQVMGYDVTDSSIDEVRLGMMSVLENSNVAVSLSKGSGDGVESGVNATPSWVVPSRLPSQVSYSLLHTDEERGCASWRALREKYFCCRYFMPYVPHNVLPTLIAMCLKSRGAGGKVDGVGDGGVGLNGSNTSLVYNRSSVLVSKASEGRDSRRVLVRELSLPRSPKTSVVGNVSVPSWQRTEHSVCGRHFIPGSYRNGLIVESTDEELFKLVHDMVLKVCPTGTLPMVPCGCCMEEILEDDSTDHANGNDKNSDTDSGTLEIFHFNLDEVMRGASEGSLVHCYKSESFNGRGGDTSATSTTKLKAFHQSKASLHLPKSPPEVFISYNWGSNRFATLLHDHLNSDYLIKSWLDTSQLKQGDNPLSKMADGVSRVRVVVMFITAKYLYSPNCQFEYWWSMDHGKQCLPILLEPFSDIDAFFTEAECWGDSDRLQRARDTFKHMKDTSLGIEAFPSATNDENDKKAGEKVYVRTLPSILSVIQSKCRDWSEGEETLASEEQRWMEKLEELLNGLDVPSVKVEPIRELFRNREIEWRQRLSKMENNSTNESAVVALGKRLGGGGGSDGMLTSWMDVAKTLEASLREYESNRERERLQWEEERRQLNAELSCVDQLKGEVTRLQLLHDNMMKMRSGDHRRLTEMQQKNESLRRQLDLLNVDQQRGGSRMVEGTSPSNGSDEAQQTSIPHLPPIPHIPPLLSHGVGSASTAASSPPCQSSVHAGGSAKLSYWDKLHLDSSEGKPGETDGAGQNLTGT